jgi:hypothetical protein
MPLFLAERRERERGRVFTSGEGEREGESTYLGRERESTYLGERDGGIKEGRKERGKKENERI